MTPFICATCGTQYPPADSPPDSCRICEDERQYVGHGGQRWTDMEELREGRRNRIEELEPHLYGVGSEPGFGIGQRALLVKTPAGNLLWDCISLLDEETISKIEELGGVKAIAISHPHFYSSMVDWAHAFGATVWLHAADREHVVRPDPAVRYWEGERLELFGGLTLIRGGGHFAGGTMAHWPQGAGGKGALLSGDIIQVVADTRWVSFMYSYPNLIPLPEAEVRRIVATVEPFEFDTIHGAWWERVVATNGKAAVRRSMERYIRHLKSVGSSPE